MRHRQAPVVTQSACSLYRATRAAAWPASTPCRPRSRPEVQLRVEPVADVRKDVVDLGADHAEDDDHDDRHEDEDQGVFDQSLTALTVTPQEAAAAARDRRTAPTVESAGCSPPVLRSRRSSRPSGCRQTLA